MRGRRVKERRADPAGDVRQFSGGSARVVEISRGEKDLDRRGKHPGASCRRSRVGENTADRDGRSIDLALRKTKQRQSWIGFTSAIIRPCIRGFSLGEVAPESMDLAQPIECCARHRPTFPGRQQPAGVVRILLPHDPSCPATASPPHDRAGTRRGSARGQADRRTIGQKTWSTRTPGADRTFPGTPPTHCNRCHLPGLAPRRLRSPRPSLHPATRHLPRCVRAE